MKRIPLIMLTVVVLFLSGVSVLSAEQRARIAVLPFSANGVAEKDARALSGLFETAMVKTEIYSVIEQNQMKAILDAQKRSLEGCTDESCAIEVGKLLAAELIVLGEVSQVGRRYIVNAKIIDVTQGRNIRADSVSADDLSQLADTGITILAYKLAGLTYREGSSERVVSSFGEVFVNTQPDGAEISVNGVRRGTSPLVIDRIPLGKVTITARKDSYYGEHTMELTSTNLVEITISMSVASGRIFIKSPEKDLEVFLDGTNLGKYESGLFKDIPAGEHIVSLRGNGLFWEGRAMVETGKTITLDAYPVPHGRLDYAIPENACAVISGVVKKEVSGTGETLLPVGKYRVRVSGEIYQDYAGEIEIIRGGVFSFNPHLEFTDEYRAAYMNEQMAAMRSELGGEITRLEGILSGGDNGDPKVALAFVEEARVLVTRIDSLKEAFRENVQVEVSDLRLAAQTLLVRGLKWRLEELNALRDRQLVKRKSLRAVGISGFVAGAAGLATMGVFMILGAIEYETYSTAVITEEVEASRLKLEMYTKAQIVGACVGGAGAILGALTIGGGRKEADGYEAEIDALSDEISRLEGGTAR